MGEAWEPDILGPGFERLTLRLGADSSGDDVVATLVRSKPSLSARMTGLLSEVDALYVHGWSDYFFQRDLARFWTQRGARFYALDLRRYGRSLRPGQRPGDVRSIDDYDVEIEAARRAMGGQGRRKLALIGHSTGGLTLTLWAARHPGVARAVILNSPWLEFQLGAVARQAIAPLVSMRARFDPSGRQSFAEAGTFYARAQREIGSLPDSPPGWRPERGFSAYPAWLAAMLEGHRRIAAGVDVGAPVLVLLSARSILPTSWNPAMTAADTVLYVEDILRAATRIAPVVTIARIDGALHDVFLSAAASRARAYEALEWFARAALT